MYKPDVLGNDFWADFPRESAPALAELLAATYALQIIPVQDISEAALSLVDQYDDPALAELTGVTSFTWSEHGDTLRSFLSRNGLLFGSADEALAAIGKKVLDLFLDSGELSAVGFAKALAPLLSESQKSLSRDMSVHADALWHYIDLAEYSKVDISDDVKREAQVLLEKFTKFGKLEG